MLNASNLKEEVVEFFYDFSRFEFSLKESGFLQNRENAFPDWDKFVSYYKGEYTIPSEYIEHINFLLENPPKKQITKLNDEGKRVVDWKNFNVNENAPKLKTLVDIVKIVRNNLFHGGKYGDSSWDDKERVVKLIKASQAAIASFLLLDDNFSVYHTNFA